MPEANVFSNLKNKQESTRTGQELVRDFPPVLLGRSLLAPYDKGDTGALRLSNTTEEKRIQAGHSAPRLQVILNRPTPSLDYS
jgi:hypothetical protein